MKKEIFKKLIQDASDLIEFEYDGRYGNIDPYYIPETKSIEYLLYFDGIEKIVNSIDEVMNTHFIEGKCLNDIFELISF